MMRGSVGGRGQLGTNQSGASSMHFCLGASLKPRYTELSVGRGHWVIEALISLVKCL